MQAQQNDAVRALTSIPIGGFDSRNQSQNVSNAVKLKQKVDISYSMYSCLWEEKEVFKF